MHQERGAPVQIAAQEIHAAIGVLPVLHHHVFQLVVQKFFGALFEGRIHFHEIGQHALRLEILHCAFFERREQALHRFGGVGAVRQHLFERLLARLQLGASPAAAFRSTAHFDGMSPAGVASSSSVRRRSPVTDSSSSCRCAMVSESDCRVSAQPLQFRRWRSASSLLHPRRFALDAGQVLSIWAS